MARRTARDESSSAARPRRARRRADRRPRVARSRAAGTRRRAKSWRRGSAPGRAGCRARERAELRDARVRAGGRAGATRGGTNSAVIVSNSASSSSGQCEASSIVAVSVPAPTLTCDERRTRANTRRDRGGSAPALSRVNVALAPAPGPIAEAQLGRRASRLEHHNSSNVSPSVRSCVRRTGAGRLVGGARVGLGVGRARSATSTLNAPPRQPKPTGSRGRAPLRTSRCPGPTRRGSAASSSAVHGRSEKKRRSCAVRAVDEGDRQIARTRCATTCSAAVLRQPRSGDAQRAPFAVVGHDRIVQSRDQRWTCTLGRRATRAARGSGPSAPRAPRCRSP